MTATTSITRSAAPRARPQTGTGFRTVLREETRATHDVMDALFSQLDLARAGDFVRFCRVHLACFRALGSVCAHPGMTAATADLSADLESLGLYGADDVQFSGPDPDPLAVDYVFAGSRLGTKVLRRRWSASGDPAVLAASRYFTAEGDPLAWPRVCAALDNVPTGSARADRIVSDTIAIYGLFMQSFQDLAQGQSAGPSHP